MERALQDGSGIRLAELVASFSIATDLGRELPVEHSIRRARLALRLAGATDLRRGLKVIEALK